MRLSTLSLALLATVLLDGCFQYPAAGVAPGNAAPLGLTGRVFG